MGHAEGVCDSGLASQVPECTGKVGCVTVRWARVSSIRETTNARPGHSQRVSHGLQSEVWKNRLARYFSPLSL